MGLRSAVGTSSILIWKSIMMSRFTLVAALAASLAYAAQTALAGAKDYALELVETTRPVGAGALLTVRLTDLRNGAPVEGAVIFATRMDMAPDGMETMTTSVTLLPTEAPGLYRFATDLVMAGNWRFSVAVKVQGEPETVEAELLLQAAP